MKLKKSNTTLALHFFITHDISEALALGDKVLVLQDGVIQQYDTPFTICDSPVNDFVNSLIGKKYN